MTNLELYTELLELIDYLKEQGINNTVIKQITDVAGNNLSKTMNDVFCILDYITIIAELNDNHTLLICTYNKDNDLISSSLHNNPLSVFKFIKKNSDITEIMYITLRFKVTNDKKEVLSTISYKCDAWNWKDFD